MKGLSRSTVVNSESSYVLLLCYRFPFLFVLLDLMCELAEQHVPKVYQMLESQLYFRYSLIHLTLPSPNFTWGLSPQFFRIFSPPYHLCVSVILNHSSFCEI